MKIANFNRMKIVGVGGGGSNAVNRLIQFGLKGVSISVINPDEESLKNSLCLKEDRLLIGAKRLRGLGAGADPKLGKLAAEESSAEIKTMLSECDTLFIVAGLGGGTGSGSVPVIASLAREMGVFTIAHGYCNILSVKVD